MTWNKFQVYITYVTYISICTKYASRMELLLCSKQLIRDFEMLWECYYRTNQNWAFYRYSKCLFPFWADFRIYIILQNGESALHGAAMFGHLDVIRTLLHAGSDVSLTNRDGNTPYQIALKYKHPHVADYLKSLISSTPKPKPSQGQNLWNCFGVHIGITVSYFLFMKCLVFWTLIEAAIPLFIVILVSHLVPSGKYVAHNDIILPQLYSISIVPFFIINNERPIYCVV